MVKILRGKRWSGMLDDTVLSLHGPNGMGPDGAVDFSEGPRGSGDQYCRPLASLQFLLRCTWSHAWVRYVTPWKPAGRVGHDVDHETGVARALAYRGRCRGAFVRAVVPR